jgi:hypothetical protein
MILTTMYLVGAKNTNNLSSTSAVAASQEPQIALRRSDPDASAIVTPYVTETLIKVINKELGANTSLNPKVEFKNKV